MDLASDMRLSADADPPGPPVAGEPQAGPDRPASRRWPPIFAPLALITGFAAALFGGILVSIAGLAAGASVSHPPPAVELVATLLQDVLFVASAVYFAARVARPWPGDFGLRATQIGQAFGMLIAAYAAFLVFAAAWESLLGLNDKEQVVQKLGANSGALGLIAVVALTCVVAPICEEFFFRGFFFPALANWRGPWAAAVVTGFVFGAIHIGSAPVGDLVPLAFFGFTLCLVRWRSRSLYPCVALHAVNNCVAFGSSEHWHAGQVALLVAAAGLAIVATLAAVARVAPAQ
jgi:membrane protease YdiL (CAAX protease family)